ncbi:sugar transferase [Verrucomicrobiales bacterium BCK34]|nr:sugar transferase [Verrucomicrobiales bacterium BCK34]
MKSIFDFTLALTGLVLLSPLILLTALLVRVFHGRPVIFCQDRPGLNGKIFRMMKFRTMREARDEKGESLSDERRLTRFGSFLRSTSLDELPELWNVLKGDMSLVGPRPLLEEYLPLYSERQARRHEVRPGLTGWAQVNGRNTLSWEERFEMDVWYVENQSFALDLKILLQTIQVVLFRRGVNAKGEATMSKFTGAEDGEVSASTGGKPEKNDDNTAAKDIVKG